MSVLVLLTLFFFRFTFKEFVINSYFQFIKYYYDVEPEQISNYLLKLYKTEKCSLSFSICFFIWICILNFVSSWCFYMDEYKITIKNEKRTFAIARRLHDVKCKNDMRKK